MHECPSCLQVCCCDQDDLWCDALDLDECRCTCQQEDQDEVDDDEQIEASP